MLLNGVTNLSTLLQTQDFLQQTQKSLNDAQTELSTGRYADVNLQLGSNVSRNLDWRLGLSDVTQFISSNTQAGNQATATQTALQSLSDSANSFINTLGSVRNASDGQTLIQSSAQLQIQGFEQTVNTSYAGQYLLGGQNSGVAPLKTYQGGAAQSAVAAAFQSYFGFSNTSSQAQNITPTQMTQFLQGPFQALFQGTNWSSDWSNASTQNGKVRIDSTQMVDASANANDPAIKNMMMGMVAVTDLGIGQLNQSTFQSVVDFASTQMSNGVQNLTDTQARVGSAQQAITAATTRQKAVQSNLQQQIQSTESVDSTQAATLVNNLMSQMQANYAVIGKISSLSLLTYLPAGA